MNASTQQDIAVSIAATPRSRCRLQLRKRWLSAVVLVLGLLVGGCGGAMTSPPAAASVPPPGVEQASDRALPDTSSENVQASERGEDPGLTPGVRVSWDGDGPLEVTRGGRGVVVRVPVEGGGRVTLDVTTEEAVDLADALSAAAR